MVYEVVFLSALEEKTQLQLIIIHRQLPLILRNNLMQLISRQYS